MKKEQSHLLMMKLVKTYHQDQQNLDMQLKKQTFMILKLMF
jgi:hypothetical protein